MTLAQRVRDLRYAKGWGPDDLAVRAEISRTALYQIESGRTELPRAATLRRIALALGVSTEELLGRPQAASASKASDVARRDGAAHVPTTMALWVPGEGGPLLLDRTPPTATLGADDDARFASEVIEVVPIHDGQLAQSRQADWTGKVQALMESPLRGSLERIVEEMYRLLPPSGPPDA